MAARQVRPWLLPAGVASGMSAKCYRTCDCGASPACPASSRRETSRRPVQAGNVLRAAARRTARGHPCAQRLEVLGLRVTRLPRGNGVRGRSVQRENAARPGRPPDGLRGVPGHERAGDGQQGMGHADGGWRIGLGLEASLDARAAATPRRRSSRARAFFQDPLEALAMLGGILWRSVVGLLNNQVSISQAKSFVRVVRAQEDMSQPRRKGWL